MHRPRSGRTPSPRRPWRRPTRPWCPRRPRRPSRLRGRSRPRNRRRPPRRTAGTSPPAPTASARSSCGTAM
ncbi:hypothetical protein DMH08_33480 [Actinomadura sp. WAC 06369]|nr:hypothetical protein DMH08_33480 [Actinomadura sp. WAC 06369]